MKKFKERRKCISFIIALLMVFTYMPSLAFADNTVADPEKAQTAIVEKSTEKVVAETETKTGNTIIASGTCGSKLTWELSYEGVLTITGIGKMDNFYGASPWESYRGLIKKIIIENGVTSIGYTAFPECTNLKFVSIPASVKSIGGGAFEKCESLTSITIPDSVTEISSSAFEECKGLTSIKLPDSVTYIGVAAFSKCSGLTSINIPNSVTYIGSFAFQYCTKLTSINIPDSVKTIGQYCFYRCWSLNSVTIGSGILNIEESTFEECTSLKSVVLPNSVLFIWDQAFYKCRNLRSISIPSSICSIGDNVFLYCDNFKYIFYEGSIDAWNGVTLGYNFNRGAIIHYNAKDHTWNNEWTIDIDSSCEKVGSKSKHCIYCDARIDEQTIPAKGHAYSVEVVKPTCTAEGFTTYTCSRCGDNYKSDYKDALGHKEVVDAAVPATCTATGLTAGSHCSVCNTVVTAQTEVPALGHTPAVDAAKDASCTETGLTEGSHCSVCNVTLTAQEKVPALGHTPAVDAAKAPTCTETGLTEGSHCSVCNVTLTAQDVVNALGHDYKSVVTDPTCTEEGFTTYTCSRCGDNYKSDYKDALGHKEVVDAAVPATCTATGLTAGSHCSVCNTVVTAQTEIPALGHTPVVDAAKDASCTETGLTEGSHCSVCDATLTAQTEVPALGHTPAVDAAKAPTCTETGLTEGSHCSVCNVTLTAQDVVNALGHDYKSVVTDPTCTEGGFTTYTCHCGDGYIKDGDDPLGHDYEAVETKPTCTEKGYIKYTCKNDPEHTYIADYVDAAGHKMTFHNEVAATCEEAGNIAYYTCDVCEGYFFDDAGKEATTAEDVVVVAIGHKYGAYKTTTKAKFGKNGVQTATCSACSDKTTKPIAAPKTIKLSTTTYTYNGGTKKPLVGVYNSAGKKISPSSYTVSYASGRKNVGKYKVTITFKKSSTSYIGSSYTTFKINPKGTSISKLSASKKAFTVKWKKQSSKMATSRITGYQYRYSTSSKMTSAVTKTVKGYSKTSAKKTKLSTKKKYYVQVRTYKSVNGTRYYSSWSKTKSVKTK